MGTGFSLAAHDAIRNAIKHDQRTTNDIAAQSGMSTDYLYKRLRNELPFTVTDIERICNTLNIDPYDLLQHPTTRTCSNNSNNSPTPWPTSKPP